MAEDAKKVYAGAMTLLERALAEAARAQWAGNRPDLHRERRALIELRRTVPNDRLEPTNQVVRDLLTAYAAVLDEQSTRDTYEREVALSEDMKAELERLRPRAARQGLPVLADDLRGFKLGRVAAVEARTPARPPASSAPRPPAAAAGTPDAARPRKRRRSRSAPGPGATS